ncbi:MAG TPA: hypothetical protein VGR69_05870, partial [Candidatus Rubrimentiphilum sp.]|nr:hypothetical protein [Candidatus Rubrimentiphilum sp.]
MYKKLGLALGVAAAFTLAACSGASNGTIPSTSGFTTQSNVAASCDGAATDGFANCFALYRTDVGGGNPNGYHGTYPAGGITPQSVSNATSGPSGYHPGDLQSAYALPSSTAGAGQTVAIVDAYDDPNAESDLGVYRSQFGLSPCTTANGCFKKVNQNGVQGSYPRSNGGWAQEISLDVDMVSAICPNCHILLVEASSNSFANLGTAANTAASLGGNAISNSYGGGESSGETSNDVYYNHPGHAVTVSSGDNGYGVEYPAASQYVTAVGGTSLSRASNMRGWTETAWSGAGAGCSAYEPKPSWQKDTGCSRRTVADV